MTRDYMRERFHELVILSALGNASPQDEAKLDRYQALLRPRQTKEEISHYARQAYFCRLSFKMLGAMSHSQPPPKAAADLLNSRFWELV